MSLHGFELIEPLRKSKYRGLFDACLEIEDGKYLAKEYGTREQAKKAYQAMQNSLSYFKKKDSGYKHVKVSKRGLTVYLHLEGRW